MAEERLYTEKEISTILKRSGERQIAQGQKETVGLSLLEIQQIAGEVGLDPAIVASVAAELDFTSNSENAFSWLKLPNKLEVERAIPGTITEDDWPEVVSVIEKSLGLSGASAQVGRMLEWTNASKFSQYKVSFSPGEGQTKVRLFGNFSRMARAWLIAILLQVAVWGTLAGISLFSLGGIPFGMVTVFLAYMMIRFGFVSYLNKKENTFHQILAQIEKLPLQSAKKSIYLSNTEAIHKSQVIVPGKEEDQPEPQSKAPRKKVT